jgi:UDP-N-acetylmuramoyl-tripeptide--D-alanyl-D-alanine ligase
VCFSIEETDVRLQIPGEHNVYNALAGAAVGREFGIPFRQIKEGLESVKSVAGRLEMRQKAGVRIIDDVYNSNLRSASVAIVLLSRLKTKRGARRFAVLADMLELGETTEYAHRKVGELCVENGIDFLFAHGEASQYTVDSARNKGHKNSWHFEDKQALLNKLGQMVREGDVVLVKGSRRMKMEDIVEGLLTKLESEEG